jgi:hypothetical protein
MIVEVVDPELVRGGDQLDHCFVVIRPGEMMSRISWSRISADVPGSDPKPAALSARR